MKTIYSWKTTKTEDGFKFVVTENVSRETPNEQGRYVDSKIVKVGQLPTRARAKTTGQKWCAYLRRVAA